MFKDRQWNVLMTLTGVNVGKRGQDFTMGPLIDMNLHEHVEGVGEIIDAAQKEVREGERRREKERRREGFFVRIHIYYIQLLIIAAQDI